MRICFMADLLFRSPHDTAAILFIDGGCESKRRAAIRGRKHPRSQRRVRGPDGPSSNRVSPASLSEGAASLTAQRMRYLSGFLSKDFFPAAPASTCRAEGGACTGETRRPRATGSYFLPLPWSFFFYYLFITFCLQGCVSDLGQRGDTGAARLNPPWIL